jgi:hypothetical protein
MNKTVLAFSTALIMLLLVGGVYAYQNGKSVNAIDRVAAQNAVESQDYNAWKTLHANSNGKMASLINESNFYLLNEMHKARESGDFAKVQEIKSQLGLGSMKGKGSGMHKNNNCPFN